jgi:hypothetical protein
MGRVIAAFAVALIALGVIYWVANRGEQRPERPASLPPAVPITIEVLNGVGVDGLARAVTMRLRERGLDVVSYGNAGMDTLSTTQVVARSGDSTLARRVQEVLGAGAVVVDPDPTLLLDVSVVLGRDVVDSTFRP